MGIFGACSYCCIMFFFLSHSIYDTRDFIMMQTAVQKWAELEVKNAKTWLFASSENLCLLLQSDVHSTWEEIGRESGNSHCLY